MWNDFTTHLISWHIFSSLAQIFKKGKYDVWINVFILSLFALFNVFIYSWVLLLWAVNSFHFLKHSKLGFREELWSGLEYNCWNISRSNVEPILLLCLPMVVFGERMFTLDCICRHCWDNLFSCIFNIVICFDFEFLP